MGFDNKCVPQIESIPWEYFCISCRTLVYPNEAMQAPCKHLLCAPCLAGTNSCPDDFSILTENNCKAVSESNKQLAEMIGKVMVCCLNHKCGCQWQGTLSDYVAHGAICAFGNTNIQPQRAAQCYNVLPPLKQQVDSGQAPSSATKTNEIPQDGSLVGSKGAILVDTTIVEATSPAAVLTENPASHIAIPQPFPHQPSCPAEDLHEMARKYANAHYLWTWHERTIESRTVLSNPKDHDEGMSLFISVTLALEANFRVNGYDVKELSPYKLYEWYVHMKDPSFSGLSKLLKVAEILKSTGTEEINRDGIPSVTYSISNYKTFNTKTLEGLSEALDHLRTHGPLVGVYFVTEYQRRNADSYGILHGVEEYVLDDTLYEVTDDQSAATSSTNAICITGFGVEDSSSFFQFQWSQDDSKIFGRVLVSSVLELIGFFVEETPVKA